MARARSPDPTSTRRWSSTSSTVEPTVAGPRRPQDKVLLPDLRANFREAYPQGGRATSGQGRHDSASTIDHGAVAIAAITSCTNTSNPTVMIGAGLLARNAIARGLSVRPTVKTSLAPGSRAVTEYYTRGRPARAARAARLRRRRLRLHDVHRQQRAARHRRRHGHRGATTSSSRRCCPATATSRAASIRWRAPATSPRRRWSWRSRWPARSRSTCSTSRWARTATASRSSWPTSGRLPRRSSRRSPTRSRPTSSDASTRGLRRRRALARPARAGRQQPLRLGRGLDLRCAAAVPGRHRHGAGAGRRHRRRARAGGARRLGHHRPHLTGRRRSRHGARPASGCRSTASRRSSSTATARGAAITRC